MGEHNKPCEKHKYPAGMMRPCPRCVEERHCPIGYHSCDEVKALVLQKDLLLAYIERVRNNVSSDNICDCRGKIGEPHKKDCLLIALYALEGCTCGITFSGAHSDGCPGKKIESLGAGLIDKSQEEANKLKVEVDRWVERSRVAEDQVFEMRTLLQQAHDRYPFTDVHLQGTLLEDSFIRIHKYFENRKAGTK